MSYLGDLIEGERKVELRRILNRDIFLYFLDMEVKRSHRYQNFFCLLILKLSQHSPKDNDHGLQICYEQLANLVMEEFRESDVLGSLGQKRLVALLPYADSVAGGQAQSRFEGSLKYYNFESEGYEVMIDRVCFPADGTDTSDLIRRIKETEARP